MLQFIEEQNRVEEVAVIDYVPKFLNKDKCGSFKNFTQNENKVN